MLLSVSSTFFALPWEQSLRIPTTPLAFCQMPKHTFGCGRPKQTKNIKVVETCSKSKNYIELKLKQKNLLDHLLLFPLPLLFLFLSQRDHRRDQREDQLPWDGDEVQGPPGMGRFVLLPKRVFLGTRYSLNQNPKPQVPPTQNVRSL